MRGISRLMVRRGLHAAFRYRHVRGLFVRTTFSVTHFHPGFDAVEDNAVHPPLGERVRVRGFSCLESTMFGNLGEAKKYLGQAAKMLIGIPDYDN